MPKLLDKYSGYDFATNTSVASTLLYGYLGNKVSDKKKMEILQKLEVVNDVDQYHVDEIRHQYGNRFDGVLNKADEANLTYKNNTDDMPGFNNWIQGNTGRYFTDPDMEPVIGIYDEGMKELLEILDKNEDALDLSAPNAKNHYHMLKGMIKNSYEGKLASKMSEDPSYGTAIALTAKIGFVSCQPKYDDKEHEFHIQKNGVDTKTVLDKTKDLGLLQAMAGSTRVHEKMEESISTGNTSRQELLYECEEQSKRLDKVMELKEETVNALQQEKILQNDRPEYTDGARGIKYSIHDMKAKQEILKGGYPVEDIPAMSAFYIQMNLNNAKISANQAELDAEKNKNPKPSDAQKESWDNRQKQIDSMKTITQDMQKTWGEVTNPDNSMLMNQERRLENLGKLKDVAQKATENLKSQNCLSQFSERIEKRMNAELNIGDRAMLANDYMEMYNTLAEADPRSLFTGSKQFKELKQAVKELAEMDNVPGPKEDYQQYQVNEKRRQVMEKAQNYLRYKDRQMNGPDGHKHKRSALEAKRVQAVNGIYSKLLDQEKSRLKKLNLREYEAAIVPETKDQDLLTPKPSGEARNFDEYIRQHTGKGAMSGTKEELIDDASKVLAAQIMPKQNPPKQYDPKEIEKLAGQIKTKFNMAAMNHHKLRDALNDPEKSLKIMAQQHHRNTYGVDMQKDYQKYLNNMRKLYRDMEKPDGKNKDYQRIYDCVEKIAHLPLDPAQEGLSTAKVGKLVEKTNSEIFEAMDRYVDHHGKNIGPRDPKMLQVLKGMDAAMSYTIDERIDGIVDRINTIKGTAKDISSREYIELNEYDRGKIFGLKKTADKVTIKKSKRNDIIKEEKLEASNLLETREVLAYDPVPGPYDLARRKANNHNMSKDLSKDDWYGQTKGEKQEKENLAPKSKEVGDKPDPKKNAVKDVKSKLYANRHKDIETFTL